MWPLHFWNILITQSEPVATSVTMSDLSLESDSLDKADQLSPTKLKEDALPNLFSGDVMNEWNI
jgi:hypothetical protein